MSITNYPIPPRTLNRVAVRRGLILTTEATQEILNTRDYRLAEADTMKWLIAAPNISEGGVTFSLSQIERSQLKQESASIYEELETEEPTYGYIGEDL